MFPSMSNKLNQIIILFLCLSFISSCGTNIFEGLEDNEATTDLTVQLEEAESVEDFNNIIDDADEIIDSETSSDDDKANAYKAKSEAIIGAMDLSPIDIFSDVNTSATDGSNPLSILDLNVDNEALIESANAMASANALGATNTDDEDLLKGVVNTMVIVNTIDEVLSIDEDGEVEAIDSEATYWENIVEIMYPDDTNTNNTISDYSQNAYDGYEESDSLTNDQLDDLKTMNTAVERVEDLFEAVNTGGTYVDPSGTSITYEALSTTEAPSSTVDSSIQEQLENIFRAM